MSCAILLLLLLLPRLVQYLFITFFHYYCTFYLLNWFILVRLSHLLFCCVLVFCMTRGAALKCCCTLCNNNKDIISCSILFYSILFYWNKYNSGVIELVLCKIVCLFKWLIIKRTIDNLFIRRIFLFMIHRFGLHRSSCITLYPERAGESPVTQQVTHFQSVTCHTDTQSRGIKLKYSTLTLEL